MLKASLAAAQAQRCRHLAQRIDTSSLALVLSFSLAGAMRPVLLQRVSDLCRAARGRRLDGLQVRSLVLGTLRNLGYDVREGMQAGWVEGGSIVLQKPGSSDYAVELQDMDGKLRSREMEQQWCQTQAQALATLRDQGVDAKIMAKREPGEVPLAVIRRMDSGRAARGITDPVKKTLGPN